jgi:transposase
MYTSQGRTEFTVPTTSGTAVLKRRTFGPHPIIEHFLKRMNLAEIIHDCLGKGCHGSEGALTHADVVRLLVHNIIVSAVPLYRISEWSALVEPEALALRAEQSAGINDDRIARSLDAMGSPRARNLFFRLALRVMKDFAVATKRIHFDTTTVTLRGDYRNSHHEPLITHGHNKDGRPDLKQLVFGLAISSDGGAALLHGVFSGNKVDDTLHCGTIDALRRLLTRNDFIYVADSKLSSNENLAYIDEGGGKFVTVYPAQRKETKEFFEQLRRGQAVRWQTLSVKEKESYGQRRAERYWCCSLSEQKTTHGYRLLWVRSSHKKEVDRLSRELSIHKSVNEFNALKLNRGNLTTRAQISKALGAIVAKHKVKQFITVEILHRFDTTAPPFRRKRHIKRRDEPSHKHQKCLYYLKITKNKAALEAQEKVDGVFPLVTNLAGDYDIGEVLDIYKYQPYVEKKFALLKSELCVAPIFLKKPHRVAAMLHIYFIAIACASLIERSIRMAMKQSNVEQVELLPEQRFTKNPTCPRVLEAFSDLCVHEVVHPAQPTIVFPMMLTERQKLLLKLLEVPESAYS